MTFLIEVAQFVRYLDFAILGKVLPIFLETS